MQATATGRGTRLRDGGLRFGVLAAVLACVAPAAAQEGWRPFGKSSAERAREESIEEIRRRAVELEAGTSSSEARTLAIRDLPMERLDAENRQRVGELLGSIALFRKLPTIGVEVDHGLYQFFTRHPDVAVSIWRAMDISEFVMTETGEATYDAMIGEGTEGVVEVLYRSPREQLVLCEGTFKAGPLLAPISGRTLLHLRTEFVRSRDGRTAVRHRVNMFVSFPSTTVETAAKVLSPVSYGIIDRNFQEVSLFLHMMTLLSTQRPTTVDDLADRLRGISEPKRESLRQAAHEAHAAHGRLRPPAAPAERSPATVRPASGTTTP